MSAQQFQKINDAAASGCSPEELYAAFLEELGDIEKQGKAALKEYQDRLTQEQIDEVRKKLKE